MSGICAVWQKQTPDRLGRTLTAVSDGLAFPTAVRADQKTAGGVGLAVHGRIPGQQLTHTDRVILACDADLLNEPELAGQAGAAASGGTAALLASLYERRGLAFLEQLRGGFALIVWDIPERGLLAAVDGFGIKRLVWHDDASVALISSRTDALRAGLDDVVVNPRAIASLLNFSTALAPDTIFEGVRRMLPGTCLSITPRESRTHRFWDMQYGTGKETNEDRLSREMEAVVEESVSAHCSSDSPARVGAFLSGGTDSSTVVGLMSRTMGQPVNAFSIGFEEEGFSELMYADIAARAYGARHHTYLVSARDCLQALPDIVRAFDQPFGNASAVPTYFCARLAADNGVDTLLAGDGGDELFGGNEPYATEKVFQAYHAIPKALRTGLIEPLTALPIPIGLARKARGYVRRANMPGVERMLSFQFLQTHPAADVFEGDFLRSLGDYSVLDVPSGHYAAAPARDHLDRLLYVDMKITLADSDLPKVMCTSELAGVRTRFPFLDRRVAEFSGRVPPRLKVKGFQKRYLFKRAFRQLLPAAIIQKTKHGFGVPVAVWMKTDRGIRELAHDTLLSARASARGYFRQDFIRELFRKHETEDSTYYGDILWTFLMLELWHRQVVDQSERVLA